LQKLEKDKQKLSELLTTKNIPKPTHAEAPKIKEESLPNLNKKKPVLMFLLIMKKMLSYSKKL